MKMSAKIWEQHVAAARQQKVSTKTYASQHGLSPSTLYYWQRKLQATTNVRGVVE
jgi:transposase-like protein